MKKFYSILSVLALAAMMCSCVSTKKIVYFQGADSLYREAQLVMQQYEMKLKPADQILVKVTCSEPDLLSVFSQDVVMGSTGGGRSVSSSSYSYGASGSMSSVYGYTITNELEPIYTEVSVIKIWKDSNDALKKRPKTVTVTLLADGKTADVDPATITLSEDGGWSYTWKELPAYDGARKIVYTVKETEVKDYTTVLSGDAETGFVITNTVDEPDEPDTGDRSNIVLPALLLCASIAIILVVVFTGKRARKKE